MITSKHAQIRATEPDDAPALFALYDVRRPRAALLDQRREPLMPTLAELREMLGMKETVNNVFFTVEDRTGAIRGFCLLRGMNQETGFGEMSLLFHEAAILAQPLAEEALTFACTRGFERMRMNKMVSNCLDGETELRDFLLRHGFISDGVQRGVLFSQGRWHNLESLSLYRDVWTASRAAPMAGSGATA